MSVGLENLVNTSAVTSSYPWKNIKDNTGAGDGTPLDKISHADFHQTFRKFLFDAGITPNGLEDNAANGYQYIDALRKVYKNFFAVRNYPSNATTTLTYATDINCLINIQGNTASKSFNLPASSSCFDSDSITFYNNTAFIAIIQSGTDFVNGGADITLISPGDFVTLVLDKPNLNWVPSAALITPAAFVISPITVGSGGSAPAYATTWVAGNPSLKFFLDEHGFVHLNGCAQFSSGSAGATVFTLPVGYRPTTSKQFVVSVNDNGTPKVIEIVVNTTGSVNAGIGTLSGVGTTTVFFDPVHFYKGI